MTIEKVSVKSTKKTDKSKGKTKAKAKATAKTGNVKQKTGKVEQTVNVNVSAPAKRRYNKRALPIKNIEPTPKFIDRPEIVNIAGRVPLVNSTNNTIPVDRNIQANPVKYLESSIPPAEHTKAFVKVKKGQNSYDVETELQHEVLEVNPTQKGKGLAENVEQQTRVKIQVDKPKKSNAIKLPVEPQTQFVQTVDGNTNKEVAFDTQAEGTFTANAEEGMNVKSPRGRPKKYANQEEAKAAKLKQTQESKIKKSLKEKGVFIGEGYRFGKVPAVIEGEENLQTLLLQPKLTKVEQGYLTETEMYRRQEKDRRKMFLEGETYANRKFVDSSLGKLYENQFDDQVNYNNNTNNNPVKKNLNETYAYISADTNTTLTKAGFQPSYAISGTFTHTKSTGKKKPPLLIESEDDETIQIPIYSFA
jgi:hypothetical protein